MTCDMLVLDYQSRNPIYIQIVNQIEHFIALGILKENDALPSIRELANYLGINPNTVKKAYTELEDKKMIVSVSTKGCYVSKNSNSARKEKIDKTTLEIEKSINELQKLGLTSQEILEKINKILK